MKLIIKSSVCLIFTLLAFPVFSTEIINIYHAKNGSALIINSGANNKFMIAGGATDQGASTASDCFAKATVRIKKLPNYYEGNIDPASNELLSVTSDEVSGRGLGIYISNDLIRVGNVELDGICADGVDFSGFYKKISNNDPRYKSAFIYFMSLEDQDAMHLVKVGDIKGAKSGLEPFICNYNPKWGDGNGNGKLIDRIFSDYSKLGDD